MRFLIFIFLVGCGIAGYIYFQTSNFTGSNYSGTVVKPSGPASNSTVDRYAYVIFENEYAPAISVGCNAHEVELFRPLAYGLVKMMLTVDLTLQGPLMQYSQTLPSRVTQQCLRTADAVGQRLSNLNQNQTTCYSGICCNAFRCSQ